MIYAKLNEKGWPVELREVEWRDANQTFESAEEFDKFCEEHIDIKPQPVSVEDPEVKPDPEPESEKVPATVSKRQLCLWLYTNTGITFDQLLAMMPDERARIEFQTAAIIDLNNPYVAALATYLKLDPQQVFKEASNIQ